MGVQPLSVGQKFVSLGQVSERKNKDYSDCFPVLFGILDEEFTAPLN